MSSITRGSRLYAMISRKGSAITSVLPFLLFQSNEPYVLRLLHRKTILDLLFSITSHSKLPGQQLELATLFRRRLDAEYLYLDAFVLRNREVITDNNISSCRSIVMYRQPVSVGGTADSSLQ